MSKGNHSEEQINKFFLISKTLTELKVNNISERDILEYISHGNKGIHKLPVSIFNQGLSPLQAAVKYLYEIKLLKFSQIAQILNRDQRTIWNTYNCAKKLNNRLLKDLDDKFTVNIDVFSDRRLSFLESLCSYLKSTYSLTYHEIAVMLGKDDRTVWTVCKRAEQKNAAS